MGTGAGARAAVAIAKQTVIGTAMVRVLLLKKLKNCTC
jgi:hypothetical protein